MVTLVDSLPPPPTLQPLTMKSSDVFSAPWADWMFRLQQKVNTAPVGSSTQSAIQFQINGVNIGGNGTVTGINFVGDINNVTGSTTALTVTAQQMSLSQLMAFAAAY